MSLFGRRKPGFAKETVLSPDDLSGEFSDRNDPAMQHDANPKEEKMIIGARAQAVMEGKTPSENTAEGKVDLFDYLESLPDLDDPFEPSAEDSQDEYAMILSTYKGL